MGLAGHLPEATPTVPGDPSSGFPGLVDLKGVTAKWIGLGQQDITYIPLRKAFLYLVALLDLFSRNVLSLETFQQPLTWNSGLEALELPLNRGRKAHRSSTPIRGVSSPRGDFVARLKDRGDQISWSGRGAARTKHPGGETLWRNSPYEEV